MVCGRKVSSQQRQLSLDDDRLDVCERLDTVAAALTTEAACLDTAKWQSLVRLDEVIHKAQPRV